MKALAIKQPWTSLICAGIKTVENRTWKTNYRGKLLLVASQKPIPDSVYDIMPLEWYDAIINHKTYGNLPDEDTLHCSAVIGFADLVDCSDNHSEFEDNMWYSGEVGWKLENIHMFNEPQLRGIKSKLNIFEIPEIDENNLPPHHKVELKYPTSDGDELVIPINDQLPESIEESRCFNLYYYDDLLQVALLGEIEGDNIIPYKTVRFETPTRTIRYEVQEIFLAQAWDENQVFLTGSSIYRQEEIPDLFFAFELGNQL